MSYVITCPYCRKQGPIPAALLGRTIKCPDCKTAFPVPALAPDVPTAALDSGVSIPTAPSRPASPSAPSRPAGPVAAPVSAPTARASVSAPGGVPVDLAIDLAIDIPSQPLMSPAVRRARSRQSSVVGPILSGLVIGIVIMLVIGMATGKLPPNPFRGVKWPEPDAGLVDSVSNLGTALKLILVIILDFISTFSPQLTCMAAPVFVSRTGALSVGRWTALGAGLIMLGGFIFALGIAVAIQATGRVDRAMNILAYGWQCCFLGGCGCLFGAAFYPKGEG